MRRSEFIRHLKKNGCELLREGGRHSIYHNPSNGKSAAVPRHSELDAWTAQRICKDLEIPKF